MKKNIISPFIELIWDIVSDPSLDHILSWSPNGTSFCIHNQELFSQDILARHFKHSNLSSFIRQLNMYNFHKNKTNTKQLEFFHKLFRRDAKEIIIGIKRKPSQADQKQGEELLRQFLIQKYCRIPESRSPGFAEQFEQDKGSENTAIDSFNRKLATETTDLEMENEIENEGHVKVEGIVRAMPRIVLNIILVNKPDEI